ncbi:RICIN domain-containing protein [Streptomyces sp. NBC_00029]|uniref:RICIN domain-containing protein n=1 Tax=Streptomyces sp. NBC_00029 TaxID=2903613 RepID=UPI0032490200
MSQIRTLACLAASIALIALVAAWMTSRPPGPGPGPVRADTVPAATSTRLGSPITRQEVIQRAQSWVDMKVPYSQKTAWSEKAIGREWRMDCSGYVSMAWKLPASETTLTLPAVTKPISSSEMLPGDILNSKGHVVLFASWIDKTKGTLTYYQESRNGVLTNKSKGSLKANFSGYSAQRYLRIIDQAAPPTPDAPSTAAPTPSSEPSPSASPAREEKAKPAAKPTPAAPSPTTSTAATPGTVPPGPRTWVNAKTNFCLEIRRDALHEGATANQWNCNNSPTQKWTTTNPGGWGTLVNANSRMCLEIRSDAVKDGATANQWTCNNSPTQSWRFQPVAGGGWSLVNANSGKCLSIRFTGDGVLADQQKCDGTPAQTWH